MGSALPCTAESNLGMWLDWSFGKLCRLILFHEQRSQIGHVPRICRGVGLPIHVGSGILLAHVACRLVLLSFACTLCFLRADSSQKKCLDVFSCDGGSFFRRSIAEFGM